MTIFQNAGPHSRMRLKLTPGQGVFLHGWLAARLTLSWQDVLANDSLTFQRLRAANLPLAALHQLQPDVAQWITAKRAALADCPDMQALWGGDAIRDFGADIADLMLTEWPPATLTAAGVTYDRLVELGLTPVNMVLFKQLTLLGWSQIGFVRAHAEQMSEPHLIRLFGMGKADVLRSLRPSPPQTREPVGAA